MLTQLKASILVETDKKELTTLDKRIEKLYNIHAFTNEELEDIRREMAEYAVYVACTNGASQEAATIAMEYRQL